MNQLSSIHTRNKSRVAFSEIQNKRCNVIEEGIILMWMEWVWNGIWLEWLKVKRKRHTIEYSNSFLFFSRNNTKESFKLYFFWISQSLCKCLLRVCVCVRLAYAKLCYVFQMSNVNSSGDVKKIENKIRIVIHLFQIILRSWETRLSIDLCIYWIGKNVFKNSKKTKNRVIFDNW